MTSSLYWKQWEIKLLGKYPDAETVRRTGRGVSAVINKRKRLQIPIFDPKVKRWQKWELKLLGKHPDAEVAGRTALTVSNKRRKPRIVLVNSPEMIFLHCRELVQPVAAKQWFAYKPKSDFKSWRHRPIKPSIKIRSRRISEIK